MPSFPVHLSKSACYNTAMQIDIYNRESETGELAAFCRDMIERSYYPAYCRAAVDMFLKYHSEEQIRSDTEKGRIWCARENGALAGTVTVANGELSRMFVSPGLRGRGVGAALAGEALAYARESGVMKITAWAVPFSRGFYEKLGFVMLNADTLDFNNTREVPVPYIETAMWPQGAPEIEILEAAPADAKELLIGQRAAFGEQCRLYDHWSIPPMKESPEDFAAFLHSGGCVLKAVSGGRIIGGLRGKVVNAVCEIGRVWVLPQWQGRHAACRLMAALEEKLQDCSVYSLYTGERSSKNLAFYARQGYAPTGRRAPAREPGPLCYDLVWLEKPNPWPEINACERRLRSV